MQQSRGLAVLTVVFVLNILHIQYFWLFFKVAEKETQIETQKAVRKLFIKLHSETNQQTQQAPALICTDGNLMTFPAKFTNSVDVMGAFALQNQILIFLRNCRNAPLLSTQLHWTSFKMNFSNSV